MKKTFLLFAFFTVSCSIFQNLNAQDWGTINGTWEGKLRLIYRSDSQSETVYRKSNSNTFFRIVLDGENAKIYNDDKNIEVKPNEFKVIRHVTNIIVYAMDNSNKVDGWVESWVFTMTQKDSNSLIVNFCRMVNNPQLPLTNLNSKFSYIGIGVFNRTK